MVECVSIVMGGTSGRCFPDSPAIVADGFHGAPPATSTTPSGAGRPGETTLRQPMVDVETAGSGQSRRLNWIMTMRPCSSGAGSAEAATESPGTAGCEAQCLLAYRALLGQMEDSPTRLKIARKVEQLADSALEGSWQKELRDKWRAAQSSCAS